MVEENVKHMSCLGALCKPFDKHISVSGMSKEEYNKKFTLNVNEVTCEKCVEIMKKQKILR